MTARPGWVDNGKVGEIGMRLKIAHTASSDLYARHA